MSIELKDPDSNLNSLVDPEQEQMLLRMKLNKDLSDPETVEVVSPLVLGDGSVNYLQTTVETTLTEVRPKFQMADNRLSLNDKMKSVLVELLENEKVKLNRSLSMTDSDMEGGVDEEEDDDDDEDGPGSLVMEDDPDSRNNNSAHKMNTVFIVREKLINDYYDYESEECQVFENPNASFDDIRMDVDEGTSIVKDNSKHKDSQEDLLLKQKIINELNVSAVSSPDAVDEDIMHPEGDESEESSSVPSTPQTPSTPSHIPVHAATNKKKKKKNRRK